MWVCLICFVHRSLLVIYHGSEVIIHKKNDKKAWRILVLKEFAPQSLHHNTNLKELWIRKRWACWKRYIIGFKELIDYSLLTIDYCIQDSCLTKGLEWELLWQPEWCFLASWPLMVFSSHIVSDSKLLCENWLNQAPKIRKVRRVLELVDFAVLQSCLS